MDRKRSLSSSSARRALCAVLAGAVGVGAAPVEAGQARRPAPSVIDGAPTVAACRAYGYDLTQSRRASGRGAMAGAAPLMMAPPPPPPAPPPPPPPPMAPPPPVAPPPPLTIETTKREQRVDEVVVTASRVRTPQYDPDSERYPNATPNPVKRTAEQPVSTFSIDVDTASYANVRRYLNEGDRPPPDAVRVEELVNYFDYDYPTPEARGTPFRPFVAVAPSPWNPGRQIVHVALQGYELDAAERPPLNLVFLVDVSGSMQGPDRLELAKKSLNLLIDRMRPQDRMALVVYAGAAGTVLAPTAGTEKLKARCAVEALEAGGSTAGGEGLALAYAVAQRNARPDGVNRIVLMTDGDFNVGVTDENRLEDYVARRRESGVYLSVYGFGRGNYQDRRMQAISQAGNGTAGYVDSLAEASRLFERDFEAGAFPIADDVKIQVEFNPARVAEWRLVGYETRALNREDFNNDAMDAGEVGSGASVTAIYEISPVGGPSSVDPLRYGREPARGDRSGELAWLKVRYKRPGEDSSRLLERPIGDRDGHVSLERAPLQTRFAVAVAGFGQLLRSDPWIGRGVSFEAVRDLAAPAAGDDPARREFVELAREAGRLPAPPA